MKNINWILFLELYKVDYFIKMKYFPIIIDSPKLNSWNTLAREAASYTYSFVKWPVHYFWREIVPTDIIRRN